MNDDLPFDESTLSAEDLATLRAFDAIEGWKTSLSAPTTPSSVRESSASYPESDDTLPIFLEEVEEDISSMLEALQKIEQEGSTQPSHFAALRRLGHKMRGTAGAMGYLNMSEIASSIEIVAEQVAYDMLRPATGSKAISSAVDVLESCLYRLAQDGQEPADAMADLRSFYTQLSIDLDQPIHEDLSPLSPPVHLQSSALSKTEASDQALLPAPDQVLSTPPPPIQLPVERPTPYTPAHPQVLSEPSSRPAAHADIYQFDTLICHSEKLLAQHAAIEHAHKQVEMAFQGLQAAQDRFQHAETLFSISLTQNCSSHLPEDFTSSSLITRIFDTAPSRALAHSRQSKIADIHTQPARPQRSSTWDELDIERYTEQDMLLLSLREATTNVDICSTRLKHAYHALQRLQQEYMMHVTSVRNDVLLMRLAPLSTTVAQMREVVMTSMLAKEHRVDFEVTGDEVEVDQELLSSLTPLLVNMLQTCINNAIPAKNQPSSSPQSDHIWLHAHALGNEIALEVGFSMPVSGGTLQTLRKHLRHLYGSISPARNAAEGISFFLRFPRFPGLLRCLIVRVADQRLLIPLSHVHSVGYAERAISNSFYSLSSLLNIPASSTPSLSRAAIQQVVFLHIPEVYTQREPVKILVDEIIDETELMVKPLASHLERLGITGSAIDGQGNVLLLLDVAELLYAKKTVEPFQQRTLARPAKILVAEDSATVRNSLIQTLSRTPYQVTEASDGLEALEALKSDTDTPDILLLDIEMPFLTGYDLLDILRRDLRFSNMKIIMLTSRTSERHEQHATELGAHAYLTKPSPPEELLNTIQRLLPSERSTS